MSDRWQLLRMGAGEPSWNMAVDEALLEQSEAIGAPMLRLYSWSKPAGTFGYSQRYRDIAEWTPLRPLIRRPTGGGFVPHDADRTYTLVFPPQHAWYSLRAEESYRRVHNWISASFQALQVQARLSETCDKPVLGRCFIGAEKHDVLAGGQKIAGAAQKRNRCGLLVQGSIQPPKNSQGYDRSIWEKTLLDAGSRGLDVHWEEMKLTHPLSARAAELDCEKYSTDAYNQRR